MTVLFGYRQQYLQNYLIQSFCFSADGEQRLALRRILEGHHVCLYGGAGMGKSWVITNAARQLKERGQVVAVTASTGIAALNLNAQTIHKFTGIKKYKILLHYLAV